MITVLPEIVDVPIGYDTLVRESREWETLVFLLVDCCPKDLKQITMDEVFEIAITYLPQFLEWDRIPDKLDNDPKGTVMRIWEQHRYNRYLRLPPIRPTVFINEFL